MTNSTVPASFLYSSLADDPDLGELVEMYVDEMPERIQSLQSVLAAEDWNELSRAAHQIKGAGGSYGFDQLTPLAFALEQATREPNSPAAIRAACDALVDACGRTRAGLPTG